MLAHARPREDAFRAIGAFDLETLRGGREAATGGALSSFFSEKELVEQAGYQSGDWSQEQYGDEESFHPVRIDVAIYGNQEWYKRRTEPAAIAGVEEGGRSSTAPESPRVARGTKRGAEHDQHDQRPIAGRMMDVVRHTHDQRCADQQSDSFFGAQSHVFALR
jgi:hypothetical protein